MAGRSPAAGKAMRMVPPAVCVFGVGGGAKKELVPPASVALFTYSTVPGACEKSRPSSRRCTPVPRNTGLYVLSMKTVTLAVSPAWRGESFMRMLWATVCSFRWNGLGGWRGGGSGFGHPPWPAPQRKRVSEVPFLSGDGVTSLATRNIQSAVMVDPKDSNLDNQNASV